MNNKKFTTLAVIIVVLTILIVVLMGTFMFRSYDVVFETKMGAGVPVQSVMSGGYVEEPTKPVMEGYIFLGWYNGEELYDFKAPVEENLNLTAKWESVINE